jgi:hypothetical protein
LALANQLLSILNEGQEQLIEKVVERVTEKVGSKKKQASTTQFSTKGGRFLTSDQSADVAAQKKLKQSKSQQKKQQKEADEIQSKIEALEYRQQKRKQNDLSSQTHQTLPPQALETNSQLLLPAPDTSLQPQTLSLPPPQTEPNPPSQVFIPPPLPSTTNLMIGDHIIFKVSSP